MRRILSIFISVLYFLVPPAAHSYTNQDVQNYLAANPVPQGCSNWTEEYMSNGQTGVKVWIRCPEFPDRVKYIDVWYIGGNCRTYDTPEYVILCNGEGRQGMAVYGYSNTVCEARTGEAVGLKCNGAVVEYIGGNVSYAMEANPCYYSRADLNDCGEINTLLATFFPIENCTDADHDGFYAYNPTSCPQGNDCNDGNPEIYPGAAEKCDQKDNNCNRETDEGACACSVKKPVSSTANIANGNIAHDQQLVEGMKFYYNSLNHYDGPIGNKWTHSYDIKVEELPGGTILFRDGSGETRLYMQSQIGAYTSQARDYSKLTKTGDTYTITEKNGTVYAFNTDRSITSITDRSGNSTIFTYENGHLKTVTGPKGKTTTFSSDNNGRVNIITDTNWNMYPLLYDGNGDLTKIDYPQADGTTSSWTYTYYNGSYLHTKTNFTGYTVTYTYDDQERVATTRTSEGETRIVSYNPESATAEMTAPDGGVWRYGYSTQLGVMTEQRDPEGNITRYTYDENRNMTSKTEPDGSVTSYTYDINGNMTSQTDALEQTTSYTYNSYGQVTGITAPDNTTTTYEYDAKGNLTQIKDAVGQITTYSYDSRGNVVQITNAQGQTTKFTYDQNNNLATVTDPTGATTSFTYDAAGNMTSQTDASGNTTRFEYNSLGRLIKVIDPSGNATNSTYYNNGNRTSETDANGNTTYYEYNYKGQLIKVKDALGNVTTYIYGGTGCSSCGGGTDKLTIITDANGNVTKYEYDKLDALVKSQPIISA